MARVIVGSRQSFSENGPLAPSRNTPLRRSHRSMVEPVKQITFARADARDRTKTGHERSGYAWGSPKNHSEDIPERTFEEFA